MQKFQNKSEPKACLSVGTQVNNAKQDTFFLFIFPIFKPLEFKVRWCRLAHLTKSALNNDELVVCVGLSNG